jgi:hypothetical protein
MVDRDSLERTRDIVGKTLRELRGSVRREQRRQRVRRWTGCPYFIVKRCSSEPMMVDLSGTGVDPLWDTTSAGYADLEVPRPVRVNRRETLGQMWTIEHDYDDIRIAIVLVVDVNGKAWLIPYGHPPYPANGEGWRAMMHIIGSRYAKNRGGRWQGGG